MKTVQAEFRRVAFRLKSNPRATAAPAPKAEFAGMCFAYTLFLLDVCIKKSRKTSGRIAG